MEKLIHITHIKYRTQNERIHNHIMMRTLYINYLNDNGYNFKEEESGIIIMEEERMNIYVDLSVGIDIKILYKKDLSAEEKEKYQKRKIGMVEYYSSDDGVWFTKPIIKFGAIKKEEIIDRIEQCISQIESTASYILEF